MPQAEGQSRGLTYLHLRSPAPGTLDTATAMLRTCVCARIIYCRVLGKPNSGTAHQGQAFSRREAERSPQAIVWFQLAWEFPATSAVRVMIEPRTHGPWRTWRTWPGPNVAGSCSSLGGKRRKERDASSF